MSLARAGDIVKENKTVYNSLLNIYLPSLLKVPEILPFSFVYQFNYTCFNSCPHSIVYWFVYAVSCFGFNEFCPQVQELEDVRSGPIACDCLFGCYTH